MISPVNLKQTNKKLPTKLTEIEVRFCGFQRQGWGKRNPRKVVKTLQTFIYKINKYLEGNVQHDIYS